MSSRGIGIIVAVTVSSVLIVLVVSGIALRLAHLLWPSDSLSAESPATLVVPAYRQEYGQFATHDYLAQEARSLSERVHAAGGPCSSELWWPRTPTFAERVPLARGAEMAVIGYNNGSSWSANCAARLGCAPVAELAPCRPDVHARAWSEMCRSAPGMALSREVVRVQGRLGVDGLDTTQKFCRRSGGKRDCCNGATGNVIVVGTLGPLWLEGLRCEGDDSMACCNAPAYGETVIAQGHLRHGGAQEGGLVGDSDWVLSDVTLCSTTSAPDDP